MQWSEKIRLAAKLLFFPAACIFLYTSPVSAQIEPDYSVVEGVDPITLVQQVLIGQGVETSNITYTGYLQANGTFSGQSNLGISSGVILTSGKSGNSVGPNNSSAKEYNNSASGDGDLNQLSGGTTEDASVLEFDFIPQSNIVEFRYVFGSEEYPEWANSSYNDVFGFFISGPGISGTFSSPPAFPDGAKNIAIVPILAFPQIYVSINNINNGTGNNGPCENCQFYVNNGTGTTPAANPYIQYDGFTTVMVASSVVIPCETYHIKLVVADISDGKLDSGVFLEANSFSSIGLGANVAFTHTAVDTAVEACNNAAVAFELFQITPVDYPINLIIGGTAENGVDYELIGNQIIIPQGDTMIVLPIVPIDDDLWEYTTETVELIYNSSLCGVDMDTLTVFIKDYPILGMNASGNQSMVCGETLKLESAAYGGIPPYNYLWSTGETSDTLMVSPLVSTTYTITITDECGSQQMQTIEVIVEGPVAVPPAPVNICLYDHVDLTVQGGTAWLWMPGGETTQSITVSPLVNTTYTVTVFDACGNYDSDEVTVTVGQPFADAGSDDEICFGQQVILTANDTPGGSWIWTDMSTMLTYPGQSITVSPADSRQYCVEVTDNCGNTLTDCLYISVFQLTANAGSDPTICAGFPAELTGSSSTGSGNFSWSDGINTFSGPTVEVSPDVTTEYILTVDDGCFAYDAVMVFVNPLPVVTAVSSVGSICPDETLTLSAGGAVDYVWDAVPPDPSLAGQTTDLNPVVAPLVNTNYILTGTDINGCVNTANAGVAVKERMFADFELSQTEICEGESLNIIYTGNAQPLGTYTWDLDGGSPAVTGQGPHAVSWTGSGPRTIRLTVTQLSCQSEEVTRNLVVNALPVADFTTGLSGGCVPLTVSFTDNSQNTAAGVTYHWDFGSAGSAQAASVSQEFAAVGTYDVSLTVTNPGGCVSQKILPALVETWPLPVAAFLANPEQTSMKNPVIGFTSTSTGDNLSYSWDPGDGSFSDSAAFTHTYADSGYYQVVLLVTNAFGCTDRFEKEVFVSPRYMLLIPSAFSPNGDGLNDNFVVEGTGVKEYSISIFDRWGSMIFFSDNIDVYWDGNVRGLPADRGIYVYRTYFRDENDEVFKQTGSINLLR